MSTQPILIHNRRSSNGIVTKVMNDNVGAVSPVANSQKDDNDGEQVEKEALKKTSPTTAKRGCAENSSLGTQESTDNSTLSKVIYDNVGAVAISKKYYNDCGKKEYERNRKRKYRAEQKEKKFAKKIKEEIEKQQAEKEVLMKTSPTTERWNGD